MKVCSRSSKECQLFLIVSYVTRARHARLIARRNLIGIQGIDIRQTQAASLCSTALVIYSVCRSFQGDGVHRLYICLLQCQSIIHCNCSVCEATKSDGPGKIQRKRGIHTEDLIFLKGLVAPEVHMIRHLWYKRLDP